MAIQRAKPEQSTKLIVMLAFARDEEGELQPAFEPREFQSEGAAKMQAQICAGSKHYEGVIAWWRTADLVNGEFGDPMTIFEWGKVPEMD